MRGVMFNGKHSYWDWGLLLKAFPVVSPPEPKTKVVEIPGTDDVIDMTETLTGKVHYKQREIKCQFIYPKGRNKWEEVYTEILNHLHGKTVEIILDDDSEYCYTGRAKVEAWEPDKHTANITITAQVNPYKTARFTGKKVL